MSYSGIEHKLRVFISSKCGGKYTIARKSLQKLLEVTGLIETYVFETDPASSEDTQSAYLEYVDGSNLCIFLVDNADGVPPAVLSEEKRAKDKHLRLIYLFCDENKKEPTPMQEEIRKKLSQKYFVVHEFSDIVSLEGVAEVTPLPAEYIVRLWAETKDCYWNISGRPYVYNNPLLWENLYQANKSKMPKPEDPNLILPGMKMSIPRLTGEYRTGTYDPKKEYEAYGK